MSNNYKWILDQLKDFADSGAFGKFSVELKNGEVVLVRFEETLFPPDEQNNKTSGQR
jgi:hypothetical protein